MSSFRLKEGADCRQKVLAYIHLHAVLPTLEVIAMKDETGREIAERARGTIQLNVLGGPSAHIIFGDALAVGQGSVASPTLAIAFANCKNLNKAFKGGGTPLALPWRGVRNLRLKDEFEALAKRIEFYTDTSADALEEGGALALATELRLCLALACAKVVAQHDPVGRRCASELPRGVMEIQVGDAGPRAHIRVDGTGFDYGMTPASNPDVTLHLTSERVAHAFFCDEVDVYSAIPKGLIHLTGLIPLADGVAHLLERVVPYVE